MKVFQNAHFSKNRNRLFIWNVMWAMRCFYEFLFRSFSVWWLPLIYHVSCVLWLTWLLTAIDLPCIVCIMADLITHCHWFTMYRVHYGWLDHSLPLIYHVSCVLWLTWSLTAIYHVHYDWLYYSLPLIYHVSCILWLTWSLTANDLPCIVCIMADFITHCHWFTMYHVYYGWLDYSLPLIYHVSCVLWLTRLLNTIDLPCIMCIMAD